MTKLTFVRLNDDWNAEPNAPMPRVEISGDRVILRFYLNHMLYPRFEEEQVAALVFSGCTRLRQGVTNDEGWYAGQCRYSQVAPAWGEFYELIGDDPARDLPVDWRQIGPDVPGTRHFLFYLRDETFECMAANWSLSIGQSDVAR